MSARRVLSILWSPIIWVGIIVFTLTGACWLMLVGTICPVAWRKRLAEWSAYRNWAAMTFFPSLPRIRVFLQQSDLSPPRIFLSNHLSMVDIPLLMRILPRGFRFISKKENFRIPCLGYCMRFLGFISIDRENKIRARRAIEAVGEQVAREKLSVWLAPEGTRSSGTEIRPFKGGPFYLANKAKVPIIPIWLRGTDRVHAKGSPFFGVREYVDVVIGADFTRHMTEEMTVQELNEAIESEVSRLRDDFLQKEEAGVLPSYPSWGIRTFDCEGKSLAHARPKVLSTAGVTD